MDSIVNSLLINIGLVLFTFLPVFFIPFFLFIFSFFVVGISMGKQLTFGWNEYLKFLFSKNLLLASSLSVCFWFCFHIYSLLKNTCTMCRIQRWQLLYISPHERYYFSVIWHVLMLLETINRSLIVDHFRIICLWRGAVLKMFSFLVFNNFTMIYLSLELFLFILLGFHWNSSLCGLMSFTILKNFSLSLFSLSGTLSLSLHIWCQIYIYIYI